MNDKIPAFKRIEQRLDGLEKRLAVVIQVDLKYIAKRLAELDMKIDNRTLPRTQ